MLKIGQKVYIRREPYDGADYFDPDCDDYARIIGLVAYGEDVLYQLDSQDYRCLWCEDDLYLRGESRYDDEPLFHIFDELIGKDNPECIRKVQSIYRGGSGYVYVFFDQGSEAYVTEPGELESNLTLYREYNSPLNTYTLF